MTGLLNGLQVFVSSESAHLASLQALLSDPLK